MSINGLTDGGALPAIEAMARFTAARQRLIASNVANLDTPGYTPLDADPKAFQAMMTPPQLNAQTDRTLIFAAADTDSSPPKISFFS